MDKEYYYDVEIEESATHRFGAVSYLDLKDKPKIDGVTLEGDQSLHDLGLDSILQTLYDEVEMLKEKVETLESKSVNSEDGVHGIRYYNGQLQIKSGDIWMTLPSVCG